MNNLPKIMNVAKQVKHRSTFPLSFSHMTTQDFGKTSVLHTFEVMPNDDIDINLSAMCQMSPMVVPTMGSFDLVVRAFFVPFRFAWEPWEEFISTLKFSRNGDSMPEDVPTITLETMETVFFRVETYALSEFMGDVANVNRDFSITAEGHSEYYNLTPKGRLWYQILLGLGYPAPIKGGADETFSAMPLLCICKIFRDYYVNPNYNYSYIDAILHRQAAAGALTDNEFVDIMNFISWAWFENDVFTAAWSNPETPEYSEIYSHSVITTDNYSYPSIQRKNNVYEAELNDVTSLKTRDASGNPASMIDLSQFGLNVLKSVRNFVLRRSVSGARYIDQMLSRFGIRLDENEARRSHFVGSCIMNPNITRVDSTSAGVNDVNHTTSSLGDFAGRGTMSTNSNHFKFKNEYNDFGMLIFISHLMPRTDYYQGVKPHVNHIKFNDFFNGDLEDVGNAPIPQNVVFDDYTRDYERARDNQYINSVFGYAPNYFEYKTQFDYLSGDFRLRSLNSQLKGFHTMRTLLGPGASTADGVPAVLNEQFQRCTDIGVQDYQKMFLTQTNQADHFIVNYAFDVRITRDCNSLGNSMLAELNEHGNDVGDLVKVRPNGKYF